MPELGVILPHFGRTAGPEAIRDISQAAEELGFASLWTADHISFPAEYTSAYPFSGDGRFPLPVDADFYEPFISMGFAAACTSRIKIGIGVCVVPHRRPLVLAKNVSTLDQLSGGRFILGAGVGWLREEIENLQADFTTRGRYTNEVLDLLKAGFEQPGPTTYVGKTFEVHDAWITPRLAGDRPLEVWIGGASKAAFRRTATYASTWFPHLKGASPEAIESGRAQVAALREDGSEPDMAMFLPVEVTDTDQNDPTPLWERWTVRGSLSEIAEVVRFYEGLGVGHVLLVFDGRVQRRIDTMRAIADLGLMPGAGAAS